MSGSPTLRIVTFKWRPTGSHRIPSQDVLVYGPTHVNRLYSGLKRCLSIPFEMTCVTDDPEGIRPEVQTISLWDEFLRGEQSEKLKDLGGCYPRLKVFSKEAEELFGPWFACVDLDTTFLKDVTDIFSARRPFCYYRAPGPWGTGWRFNCGLFSMEAGTMSYVWSEFLKDLSTGEVREKAKKKHAGTDQSWCNHVIDFDDPRIWYWSKDHGIYDMRQHLIEAGLEKNPPDDCRIVTWPGPRDPSVSPWKHLPWVKESWRD